VLLGDPGLGTEVETGNRILEALHLTASAFARNASPFAAFHSALVQLTLGIDFKVGLRASPYSSPNWIPYAFNRGDRRFG
jgi:hypothetical protein